MPALMMQAATVSEAGPRANNEDAAFASPRLAAVADGVIHFAAIYDPRVAGLATTLTAVALSNDGDYLVANVGDSRTYLLRDDRLRRLTRDHSMVQLLIDRGAISEPEARRHPQRSVVLEALDGVSRPLPPVTRTTARLGDRLLLCSDGVSDYLCDDQIAEAIRSADLGDAARTLVQLALDEGARDNVTAVLAEVVARTDPRDGWLDYLPLTESAA